MITATLAAWVPTLTFEVLPARARSRAKLAIFDACGTALAGTHHPAVQLPASADCRDGLSAPGAHHRRSATHQPARRCLGEAAGSRCNFGTDTMPLHSRLLDAL